MRSMSLAEIDGWIPTADRTERVVNLPVVTVQFSNHSASGTCLDGDLVQQNGIGRRLSQGQFGHQLAQGIFQVTH